MAIPNNVIVVIVGAAILIAGLIFALRIVVLLRNYGLARPWIVLSILIGFFFLGYVFTALLFLDIAMVSALTLEGLVTAIFFFGAVFVTVLAVLNFNLFGDIFGKGIDDSKAFRIFAEHVGMPAVPPTCEEDRPHVPLVFAHCAYDTGHIRRSEDRKAFRRECVVSGDSSVTDFGSGLSETALDSTQPIGSATEVPAFELDESQAAIAIELLAKQIGPMARILVKREAVKANSLPDLVARLAANIPDDDARSAFTDAMARLG